jgi:hypothetical protein
LIGRRIKQSPDSQQPALPTFPPSSYGDITPWTPAEQLVAVAFMAFAVFYFGWAADGVAAG